MRKGGLSGCRKGLRTVPLAQALLSLKPAKTTTTLPTELFSLTTNAFSSGDEINRLPDKFVCTRLAAVPKIGLKSSEYEKVEAAPSLTSMVGLNVAFVSFRGVKSSSEAAFESIYIKET